MSGYLTERQILESDPEDLRKVLKHYVRWRYFQGHRPGKIYGELLGGYRMVLIGGGSKEHREAFFEAMEAVWQNLDEWKDIDGR